MVYHHSTLKRSEKRVIRKVFSEWKMNVRPLVSSSETQALARYERELQFRQDGILTSLTKKMLTAQCRFWASDNNCTLRLQFSALYT